MSKWDLSIIFMLLSYHGFIVILVGNIITLLFE
jgi:hypothetical protein